jgi:hypothetical protein
MFASRQNSKLEFLKRLVSTATALGLMASSGPAWAYREAHQHRKAGSPDNECITCHMLKIEQTIADQNVRSHTFHYVPPAIRTR